MTAIKAYIGLGSNLGNRQANIQQALQMLAGTEQIEALHASDTIETNPLGGAVQPMYLNVVAEVKTTLTAERLYNRLVEIETALGRKRSQKWAPRTIDLDLILCDEQVVSLPHLSVPHPQMHLRSFVLKGLCQLNPDLVHPGIGETVGELARRLQGCDFALNPDVPQLVNVAGIIGVGKTTLAKKLTEELRCEILLEPYDTNPFLPEVYAGKHELALDSQLYFLMSRVEQLNEKTLVSGQVAISDYVFEKELIYAKRLLDEEQLDLYKKLFEPMAMQVAKPVLVIYIQDSPQNCLERIHRRNRPYEQKIELKFLEQLSVDYEKLFTNWKTCPIIRISVSEFDCLKRSDIEHLINQIKYYIGTTKSVTAINCI